MQKVDWGKDKVEGKEKWSKTVLIGREEKRVWKEQGEERRN